MRRFFILIAVLLFAIACRRSEPIKENEEQSKQALESLFDSTPPSLRNTDHFHSVEIKQMQFIPATIKVNKGDTIEWINNDIVVHDITEEKNKDWASSPVAIGSKWQKVADKSADYFCSIHVVMKGKIIVE